MKIGSFSESEANLSTLHICKIDKIWQRQTREEEDEVLEAGVKKTTLIYNFDSISIHSLYNKKVLSILVL